MACSKVKYLKQFTAFLSELINSSHLYFDVQKDKGVNKC